MKRSCELKWFIDSGIVFSLACGSDLQTVLSSFYPIACDADDLEICLVEFGTAKRNRNLMVEYQLCFRISFEAKLATSFGELDEFRPQPAVVIFREEFVGAFSRAVFLRTLPDDRRFTVETHKCAFGVLFRRVGGKLDVSGSFNHVLIGLAGLRSPDQKNWQNRRGSHLSGAALGSFISFFGRQSESSADPAISAATTPSDTPIGIL